MERTVYFSTQQPGFERPAVSGGGGEAGQASPRMVPENAMILSPRLAPPSPLPARHPQTQRALVRGHEQSVDPHSSRIERPAARGGAGEAAPAPLRKSSGSWKGVRAEARTVELRAVAQLGRAAARRPVPPCRRAPPPQQHPARRCMAAASSAVAPQSHQWARIAKCRIAPPCTRPPRRATAPAHQPPLPQRYWHR